MRNDFYEQKPLDPKTQMNTLELATQDILQGVLQDHTRDGFYKSGESGKPKPKSKPKKKNQKQKAKTQ